MSRCERPPDVRSHAGGMACRLILSPPGRGGIKAMTLNVDTA
jgi:hypothetical protein